jgi:hypothetical protein
MQWIEWQWWSDGRRLGVVIPAARFDQLGEHDDASLGTRRKHGQCRQKRRRHVGVSGRFW